MSKGASGLAAPVQVHGHQGNSSLPWKHSPPSQARAFEQVLRSTVCPSPRDPWGLRNKIDSFHHDLSILGTREENFHQGRNICELSCFLKDSLFARVLPLLVH